MAQSSTPSPHISPQAFQILDEFRGKHKMAIITMLFTDIVDSAKLKQSVGEALGVALILKSHELVRSMLKEFEEAEEISLAGDSFFIVFVRPSDAVRFALQFEGRIRAEASEGHIPLRTRIGIHLGEVFAQQMPGGDKPINYFGLQVDTAARVMSLSQGEQILCTRPVFDHARQALRGHEIHNLGEISWLNHGEYRLKGVEDPLEVCEIGFSGRAVLAPPPAGEKAWPIVREGIEEVHGWRPAPEQPVQHTDWVLMERLGEGVFGETWRARNRQTKELRVFKFCFKTHLVKMLKAEVALFRLLREKTGERHPFVRIHDVHLTEEPYYLAMEHVNGPDLARWVETEKQAGRPISLKTKLEIIAQAAEALAVAHGEDVVHNDVKPTNIFVSPPVPGDPRPFIIKLADFGVGQVLRPERLKDGGISLKGSIVDSLLGLKPAPLADNRNYTARELTFGQKPSPQSDLYALGVVLYQLVQERMSSPLPPDWAQQVKHPILLKDLRRLLHDDPALRPKDGREVARDLRRLSKRAWARRGLGFGIVFAIAAILFGIVWGIWQLGWHKGP